MNGEMDFMILNSKLKGMRGAVDNIDEKVALESSMQELKTLVENSCGDASTSQEILTLLNRGVVKSVQQGYVKVPKGGYYGTAKINSVNMGKSFLLFTGLDRGFAHLTFDSSTTIAAWVQQAVTTEEIWVHYQVVEFY